MWLTGCVQPVGEHGADADEARGDHVGRDVEHAAGVGAATYSGTIQLTGPQVPGGEKIYTSKKSYDPRLALSDFIEARWHHFGISISYAAPRIYGDGYEAKVSNFSANIGYTYYF